jgi:hypothetical protein
VKYERPAKPRLTIVQTAKYSRFVCRTSRIVWMTGGLAFQTHLAGAGTKV